MSWLKSPLDDAAHPLRETSLNHPSLPLPAVLAAALGWIVVGFNEGSTVATLSSLQTSYTSLKGDMGEAKLRGAVWLGVMIAAIAAAKIGDSVGRKWIILIGTFLHAIGFGVASVGVGLWDVLVGRIVFGVGTGFVLHSVPMYIAEISPAHARGMLVAVAPAFLALGTTLGSVTGLMPQRRAWYNANLIGVGLAIVCCIASSWLPSSPRWLVLSHGRHSGAAQAALIRIRGPCEATAITAELTKVAESIITPEHVARPAWRLVFGAMALVCLEAAGGHVLSVKYLHALLTDALTVEETSHIAVALALVSTSLFSAAMVGVALVDRVGRRGLLMFGCVGAFASCVGLAVSFHKYGTDSSIITITLLVCCLSFYQVGFGTVLWLTLTETFPLPWRSRMISGLLFLNGAVVLTLWGLTGVMLHDIGPVGAFVGHAVVNLISCLFVKFFLIDATGRSLE